MNTLTIQSIGAPPERHADRVVAEMLQAIVKTRLRRMEQIGQVLLTTPDGNPRAQRKLADKLMAAGGGFLLHVAVEPGKRGRYKMILRVLDGWDSGRRAVIYDGPAGAATIPERPWLTVTTIRRVSAGRHDYDVFFSWDLFVTHHALSRLAQRCGARTPADLMAAAAEMWATYVLRCFEQRGGDWVRDGFELEFALNGSEPARAVLARYDADDMEGAVVVVTIVGGDEAMVERTI